MTAPSGKAGELLSSSGAECSGKQGSKDVKQESGRAARGMLVPDGMEPTEEPEPPAQEDVPTEEMPDEVTAEAMASGEEAAQEREELPEDGDAPDVAPDADGLPQDFSKEEKKRMEKGEEERSRSDGDDTADFQPVQEAPGRADVVVIRNGRILCATRHYGTGDERICGPGGCMEKGETPEQAAGREAEEMFGIQAQELLPIGNGLPEETGTTPHIFLCMRFTGEPVCADPETGSPKFRTPGELRALKDRLDPAFLHDVNLLLRTLGVKEIR